MRTVRISTFIFLAYLIFTVHTLSAHEADTQLGLSNLQKAEKFLQEISKKPNVHALHPSKLYCEILQEGNALGSLDAFNYKIYTLENEIIIDTFKEKKARRVCLNSAILGFTMGIQGMKLNEKRKLYIHPDLAYRNISIFVPAQSLIIIEVEAID